MRLRSDRRAIQRWMFLCFGVFIIIRIDLVVNTVNGLRPWARILFPDNIRNQNLLMGAAMLLLLQSGLLCLATAWGISTNRRWSRWTGFLACLSLLPGLPWFTLAGAAGVCVLLAVPLRLGEIESAGQCVSVEQNNDYWSSKKNSTAQWVIYLICGAFVIVGMQIFARVAEQIGLPDLPQWELAWGWWIYLIPVFLANTAVHELGHALAAWTLRHSVRAVSIGPLTFSKDLYGYHFQFDWTHLLDSSGYMRSVPTLNRHVRLRQIAIVAAGPAASLVSGLLALAVFYALPVTNWRSYWGIVALDSVLGLCFALMSMIPVGYSDGTMLFHLILWTGPGQILIERLAIYQMLEDAEACHGRADFEKEVRLREMTLQQALQGKEDNAMTIAVCHQYLGHAKMAFEDWTGAEMSFRKCLEFQEECTANPSLAANVWTLLHATCVERHHVAEARRTYAIAATILYSRKKTRTGAGLSVTRTMAAQLHQREGKFDSALEEAREALRILPHGVRHSLLRAELFATQAHCEVCIGQVDSGLAAASLAAEIIRSGQIAPAQQNLGWDELGKLGREMWRAGQAMLAVDLMREAIARLELRGALTTAAQHRTKLASILGRLGRLEEALALLPKEDELPVNARRGLLAERAQLRSLAGFSEAAVSDSRELLTLWRSEPTASAEVAAAQGLLARVCLESGDHVRAEVLAQQVVEILEAWQHPEAQRCVMTLALARWQAKREWISGLVEKFIQNIESDPLLRAAEKAWLFEAEAGRLERFGRAEEAQMFRHANTWTSEQARTR